MDPSTPASSVEDLDRSDRIVEGIALSLVLFISLFLNAAVIWIVLKHKTLRSKPANIFVANLCVSNLVMMVLVVPFSLTTVFLNRHDAYSKAACQTNGFFSVVSSTCIVMTLCCISLDRYVAVARPTRYKTIISTRRVGYLLLVVWAQGLLIASLPLFGWSKYEYHPATLHCSPYLRDQCAFYFFLAFVGFLVPIVVMILTYLRIFLVIRQHSRKVSTCKQPALTGATVRGPIPTHVDHKLTGEDMVEPTVPTRGGVGLTYTCSSPQAEISYEEPTQAPTDDVTTKPAKTKSKGRNIRLLSIENETSHNGICSELASTQIYHEPASMDNERSMPKSHPLAEALKRVRAQKRRKRQLPAAETRVAKTGLLLLVIFLVLWMPYLVVHSCFGGPRPPAVVFRLAIWLVYMNGIANPLVYALMNSNVKQKFKTLVANVCAACCCRRRRQ